jgi:transcriptional regulator with XRE-family HTH domain
VQRMESKVREPNLGYLAAFAEALDIEPADIFRHPDAPTRDELLRQQATEQLREALATIEGQKTGTNN